MHVPGLCDMQCSGHVREGKTQIFAISVRYQVIIAYMYM